MKRRAVFTRRAALAAMLLCGASGLRWAASAGASLWMWLSVPRIAVRTLPVVLLPIVNGFWDESRIQTDEAGLLEGVGRYPGDTYGMVIAGHVTLEGNRIGPFYRLRELRAGDRVFVITRRDVFAYRVEASHLVEPEDVRAVYVRDGDALTLLTCARWDARAQRYAQRLLVRARLVQRRRIRADA